MGTLYVVATPIGNLNDLSLRALEILKNVDVIAAEDTRQSIKILNHYNFKNKLVAYHKFNENRKSDDLIDLLLSGKDIAIVTDAGTPCISDPGYVVVRKARENGIPVLGIPGPSATVTALSISGLDTSIYCFLGFLPTDNTKFNSKIDMMKNSDISTFIIYESPKRIVKLLERLKEEFSNSNIFVASDLTKIHERSFFGSISEVYENLKNDPNVEKGEYVLILEKCEHFEEEKEMPCLESIIVDVVFKNKVSIKEAMELIAKNNKDIHKNELYEASLNLKKYFSDRN